MRAQRAAVTPLPVRDRGGAGVTSRILTSGPAGPEAGPHVAAIGRIEVPPRVTQQAGSRYPAAAPQDLVRPEPGLRVVAVHVGGEAGIGPEVVRDPLPHVADHLTAPERAVAGREGAHVGAAPRPGVQVRAVRCRRVVAPGEPPLARRDAPGTGTRFEGGRGFPLRFGGQAAPGPGTEGPPPADPSSNAPPGTSASPASGPASRPRGTSPAVGGGAGYPSVCRVYAKASPCMSSWNTV